MADQNNNQLQVILKEQHVPKAQAERLVEAFGGPFNEVGEILADYQSIKVTDVADVKTMQQARVKRLALKKARTTVETKRKELKEAALREGRAIDSIARFVKETIAPAEQYLQLQEDYAKLEAQRQADAKRAARLERLSKYPIDPTMYNLDAMNDEQFDALVADFDRQVAEAEQARKDEEAAAAKQAEAEREAQAQRDLEAKRLRAVNALGFAIYEDGTIKRGTFDATPAGLTWPSIVTMSDKGYDKTVADMIKAADAYDAEQAEARKAEQAKQAKITERVNWLSSLGVTFNGTDYRLASKVEGIAGAVVSRQEIENDTDEAFAKALQLVEEVAKVNADYDTKRDAELKAAREKQAADDRAEQERKAKAEADERAALLAPDKTKLLTLADGLEMVRNSKLPALKTKQAQDIVNDIDADLTRLIANIRAKADRLK